MNPIIVNELKELRRDLLEWDQRFPWLTMSWTVVDGQPFFVLGGDDQLYCQNNSQPPIGVPVGLELCRWAIDRAGKLLATCRVRDKYRDVLSITNPINRWLTFVLQTGWHMSDANECEENPYEVFLTPSTRGTFHHFGAVMAAAVDQLISWQTECTDKAADPPEKKDDPPPNKKSRQEVAKKLEELRSQGQPWTSQQKLAEAIGCSVSTINVAIRETETLQNWANSRGVTRRATSLNQVELDRTAQKRELSPDDEAAIIEYLAGDITTDEAKFFMGLSIDDQLFFLTDPDKHQKILGRQA